MAILLCDLVPGAILMTTYSLYQNLKLTPSKKREKETISACKIQIAFVRYVLDQMSFGPRVAT